MQEGRGTDPDSPEVQRLARLAEATWAADRESLEARTSLGLARLFEDRYADVRSLLVDVPASASAALRAQALAVRGMAECELGALADAQRIARNARALAPAEPLVELLDLLLASKAEPAQPA